MEKEVLENDVELDSDFIDSLSTIENEALPIEIDSPDVDLDVSIIDSIKRLFDAGSTRSAIAKELGLDRDDVIEVLGKYHVGRSKINGKNTQEVDFVFDGTGKVRVELGDRLNTCIYVNISDSPEEVKRKKDKWLKILNEKNDERGIY